VEEIGKRRLLGRGERDAARCGPFQGRKISTTTALRRCGPNIRIRRESAALSALRHGRNIPTGQESRSRIARSQSCSVLASKATSQHSVTEVEAARSAVTETRQASSSGK
jgi:hypothetical protein